MTWNDRFLDLFERCVKRYRAGDTDFTGYYGAPADAALLAEIGYKPREFFDFVEDFCEEGTPSPSTALLVAAVVLLLRLVRVVARQFRAAAA